MAFENIELCPICDGKKFIPFLICTDHTTSKRDFQIVQCTNCNFKVTSPRPDQSEIGEYYKSDSYISHTGGSKKLIDRIYLQARKRALKKKRLLIEQFAPHQGRLLDYGCGTGDFLNESINAGWKGAGFEPSTEARTKATQLVKQEIYADVSQILDNQYNTITMWHVLEHVHQLNTTIQKLSAALADNGTIFIAVPNPMCWDAEKYSSYWAAYDVPRHLWHFSKDNMKALLEKHNLQIKAIRPMMLDSYYVSLLSEQYKNPRQSFLKRYFLGFINGLVSNWKAKRNINHSSLIYVAQK